MTNTPDTTPADEVERVARALSIPEHHTTWDLLTEQQKDLYRMQANYAIEAMQRPDDGLIERLGEALFVLSDKLRASHFFEVPANHAAYEKVVVAFQALSRIGTDGGMG